MSGGRLEEKNVLKHHHELFNTDKPCCIEEFINADMPCRRLDCFEPTPINHGGVVQAVDKVERLPGKLMQYCEEYIAALSHLNSITDNDHLDHHVSSSLFSSSTVKLLIPLYQHQQHKGKVDLSASPADPNMRIHPYQHEQWMKRYQDLVEYQRARGHCSVPYVYKEDPRLGQWVKRQRHQYKLQKQGHHSNLTQERIQMLEILGFIWDSHGAAWDEKFQELKQFRKIRGHCNVPCVYRESSKLSTWIKRQRRHRRLFMARKPCTMEEDRIAKLEHLGFVWDYYGETGL
jgi:hypothetical protein